MKRRSLLWVTFWIAAIGLSVVSVTLVRRSLGRSKEMIESTVQEEGQLALERIHRRLGELKRNIEIEIIGYHFEGLSYQLREWDRRSDLVVGTLILDESGKVTWQTGEPLGMGDQIVRAILEARGYFLGSRSNSMSWIRQFSRIDQSHFGDLAQLGYFSENVEIIAYEGDEVSPIVGWIMSTEGGGTPWVCWHQLAASSQIRCVLVDPLQMMENVRTLLPSEHLVRSEVMMKSEGMHPDGLTLELEAIFPGAVVVFRPGSALQAEHMTLVGTYVLVSAFAIILVTCAAVLILYSRREERIAARKTTFVSQVSHELRTPLTSIRMYSEMLENEELPGEKKRKYLKTITSESRRLADLIERLLTFSEVEQEKRRYQLEELDLSTLVEETLDASRAVLESAMFTVEVKCSDPVARVLADASVVKQALFNLIDNALKYANEAKRLSISVASEEKFATIEVADSGPGIPLSLRERIFEPFYQGASQLNEKSAGVGLGLSIARKSLRATGGDLLLKSSGGSGAVFVLQLPTVSPS